MSGGSSPGYTNDAAPTLPPHPLECWAPLPEDIAMPPIHAPVLEEALQQLSGIQVARVSLEEGDCAIEKVHILIDPARAPKKAVRDIESFLLLRFNIRLDYRKISLVQSSAETMRPVLKPRPVLVSVEQHPTPEGQRVRVCLHSEEREYAGDADDSAGADLSTLAAQATLRAVQAIITGGSLEISAVGSIPFGSRAATLVGITATNGEGEEELLGASYVRDDALDAAARATLDALNRRFFSAW
ncbi:MAG TPA: hypothetical protein VF707_01410 [Ardenticatenaceae bacterium]